MTNSNHKKNRQQTECYDEPVDNGTFQQNIDELNDEANTSVKSPSTRGSNSVSGSTPDLESDDDVLENAHAMGIAPDVDFENPKELNIAKDIENAEKSRRSR